MFRMSTRTSENVLRALRNILLELSQVCLKVNLSLWSLGQFTLEYYRNEDQVFYQQYMLDYIQCRSMSMVQITVKVLHLVDLWAKSKSQKSKIKLGCKRLKIGLSLIAILFQSCCKFLNLLKSQTRVFCACNFIQTNTLSPESHQ